MVTTDTKGIVVLQQDRITKRIMAFTMCQDTKHLWQ